MCVCYVYVSVNVCMCQEYTCDVCLHVICTYVHNSHNKGMRDFPDILHA